MEERCLGVLITILGFATLWQQASAEGCFWNSRCQNLWMGSCGNGHTAVETSNDCQGLCAPPQYGTCPPFFTRFQCCKEDKAEESTFCSRCATKKEIGDEWYCCSDCSEPAVTDAKSKTGYCQTDAHLRVQPKPRELFKWNARAWTSCRGGCKKASQTREVQCLRYMENAPHLASVVFDDKCSASTKPSTKEQCTPPSCMGIDHHKHRGGLPIWATILITLTCLVAVGALAFVGFVLYRRSYDFNHGFVYVQLDSYS